MIPETLTIAVKDKEGISDTSSSLDRGLLILLVGIAVTFYMWWGLL